jgi:uncharacterized protein (DUF2235 family)
MKRIVICCDGTWNTPDQKDRGRVRPSNVALMALAVADMDARGIAQIVHYDKGVGTGWADHLLGGAFGLGLSKNIEQAYRYIMERYEPGDEVFLFGFSRGAYTVRSTAGLIRNSGLLKGEHAHRFPEAYALYRRKDRDSHPRGVEAQIFRKMYSRDIRIEFIGVWDTVGALGIPFGALRFLNRRAKFHDVKLSSIVANAFQALAIDERRWFFRPTLWERQEHASGQRLEQVWFAGVHSNVGGGYEDSGLSDLAFLWMVKKAEETGLAFDGGFINTNVRPNPAGEMRDSKTLAYEFMPDYVRPMGVSQDGNEFVHSSAVTRMKEPIQPAYEPPNLTDYLKRSGKVASS